MEAALKAAGRNTAVREGADHRADQLRADHRGREQAGHLLQRRVPRRGGEGAGDEVPLADPEVQPDSPSDVICFIDEPILSAFGCSTYVSVQRDDVVAKLREVIEAVHAEGALAGVHCCGNTEWTHPDRCRRGHRELRRLRLRRDHRDVSGGGEAAPGGAARRWRGASCRPQRQIQAQTAESPGGEVREWWTNLAKAAGISRRADRAAGADHAVLRHRLAAGRGRRAGLRDCSVSRQVLRKRLGVRARSACLRRSRVWEDADARLHTSP